MQLRQVRIGYTSKLNEDLIHYYAKKEYDANKMSLIRELFEYSLTIEDIELFINKLKPISTKTETFTDEI